MTETFGNSEMAWYVLAVLPSHEFKVRDKLIALSKSSLFAGLIEDVKLATQIKETKTGKQKEKVHSDITKYVFVKMIHTDETYNAVKVQGVQHILGAPTPMSEEQLELFLGNVE